MFSLQILPYVFKFFCGLMFFLVRICSMFLSFFCVLMFFSSDFPGCSARASTPREAGEGKAAGEGKKQKEKKQREARQKRQERKQGEGLVCRHVKLLFNLKINSYY